ncbi:MAG: hypothetical protein JO053_13250 [Acidobacteria bacterium]|nr:hypothetical protein [Acidobacteriota bacterium]
MNDPPDELRRISSRLTLYVKFVTPLIGLFLLGNFSLFAYRSVDAAGLGALGIFGTFFGAIVGYHLWNAFRIKAIKADSRNLYISNYFKETMVPLANIADVTEILWLEPRVVTIHFNTSSEFGQKVAFLAPWRMFNWYRPSPIVDELRRMAGQTVYNEISTGFFS